MRLCVTFVVLLTAFPALPVTAQPQGRSVLDEDALDRVRVQLLDSPSDVRGRFVALDADIVTVLVSGRKVAIPLSRVGRVDVGGDPVSNGSLVGALVAAVWCLFACSQGLDSSQSLPGAVLGNAAIGALIGAGIDGAHSDRRTIYRSPRSGSKQRSGLQTSSVLGLTLRF